MNCRQAKREIALCVGEDLTDADRREKLRHHLTGCPECRTHYKRLKGMFHVLEQAEGQRTYDSADSLWPALVGRLGQPRSPLQGPRFNGWVPFSVMAAACVLLMIVMEMQPDPHTPIAGSVFQRDMWSTGFRIEHPGGTEPLNLGASHPFDHTNAASVVTSPGPVNSPPADHRLTESPF
jgi:hypothetical protein